MERGRHAFYTAGMNAIDDVLDRLQGSAFRRRFRLGASERAYLAARGDAVIAAHARDFVAARLAPAVPANDGRQTPWRGHPVFIAQHATATCCRSCLARWHGIEKERALSAAEQDYVVAVIARWLGLHDAGGERRRDALPDTPAQGAFDF